MLRLQATNDVGCIYIHITYLASTLPSDANLRSSAPSSNRHVGWQARETRTPDGVLDTSGDQAHPDLGNSDGLAAWSCALCGAGAAVQGLELLDGAAKVEVCQDGMEVENVQ